MEITFENYDKLVMLKNIDSQVGRDIRKFARKAIKEYKQKCEEARDKK